MVTGGGTLSHRPWAGRATGHSRGSNKCHAAGVGAAQGPHGLSGSAGDSGFTLSHWQETPRSGVRRARLTLAAGGELSGGDRRRRQRPLVQGTGGGGTWAGAAVTEGRGRFGAPCAETQEGLRVGRRESGGLGCPAPARAWDPGGTGASSRAGPGVVTVSDALTPGLCGRCGDHSSQGQPAPRDGDSPGTMDPEPDDRSAARPATSSTRGSHSGHSLVLLIPGPGTGPAGTGPCPAATRSSDLPALGLLAPPRHALPQRPPCRPSPVSPHPGPLCRACCLPGWPCVAWHAPSRNQE